MLETSDDGKTAKQLRIERRAGKDIRDVIVDAHRATDGTLKGAARWISGRYGVPVSFGTLNRWIDQFGGRVPRVPEFPQ